MQYIYIHVCTHIALLLTFSKTHTIQTFYAHFYQIPIKCIVLQVFVSINHISVSCIIVNPLMTKKREHLTTTQSKLYNLRLPEKPTHFKKISLSTIQHVAHRNSPQLYIIINSTSVYFHLSHGLSACCLNRLKKVQQSDRYKQLLFFCKKATLNSVDQHLWLNSHNLQLTSLLRIKHNLNVQAL